MSLFGKIFGNKNSKSNETPSPQEAIQRIREVEELLEKRSALIEKKIEEQVNIARENGIKNKRRLFSTHFLFFLSQYIYIYI